MNKDKLIKIFKNKHIDTIGIAPIGPYKDLKKVLEERVSSNLVTGMEEKDIEKRTNPRLIMNDAKSIIVCAFPYYIGELNDSNLSKYCYGRDYHIVVKEILENICEEIKIEIEDFEYKVFADNGPLVDRYLAYLAGIGYYGINNNIITDKYGSYIFIGYIVNNFKFETDSPMDKTCCKCNKCVKYCPGNALEGNYNINPKKCLSYLTQKKEDLSKEEKAKIRDNKMIFGCDICQDVCPHNEKIEKTNIDDFKKSILGKLDITEIDNMSNKEFKRRYGDRAFSWRGRKIIKRNMNIVLGKSVD